LEGLHHTAKYALDSVHPSELTVLWQNTNFLFGQNWYITVYGYQPSSYFQLQPN
jgi:hypothetical protein